MSGSRRRRGADGLAVLAAAVALTLWLAALSVPSPALFGGLLAGLVRALAGTVDLAVPRPATTVVQAVVGVAIGALADLDALRAVGADWLPVLLVTVGTLALSLAAGQLLRLRPGVSPVTGAFAMIAGGASGITAMARDLGADERMVAVLQYLRVLLITVAMPLVATAFYGARPGAGGATAAGADPGWPAGLAFTAGCAVAGLLVGRLVHLPVPALLGPLVVTAVVDLAGLSRFAVVPEPVQDAAFLVLGLQVGLGFTRAALRTVGRALPLALAIIAGLGLACAALGAVLARTAGVTPLDGYLATTPGGLYVVLATATDSGADVTFVLAVQILRLFAMLASAPLVARWMCRPRG